MQVDTRSAVSDVMGTFNFNDDASITEEEFVNGCKIWIDETKSVAGNLFKQFDLDGDKSISMPELEKLITTVKFGEFKPQPEDIIKELFKEFDKYNKNIIDEPEFDEGVDKWLNKAVRVANTPDRTGSVDLYDKIVWKHKVYDKWDFIKSVFQVLSGIVMLTFLGGPLKIHGGVTMNNLIGLKTLLAIVYAKDLTWDFSA
ncbi:hypothetical protein BUALT_Bualt14G0056300 [Buddleja alternifolia]|uniref:EF-hand domain-containing protein n=1 Tax=Buddleja alternifolia TaxID=168488 RepID=A0AAV6WH49_9LAMI|nr:hypothetical protein BUALT_Bualt14G0056100 [Buddleja alternifolia]KAG8369848.1 hypothetical protein BUALT_Bualt14G0056300 [Buddleja alternifolia]